MIASGGGLALGFWWLMAAEAAAVEPCTAADRAVLARALDRVPTSLREAVEEGSQVEASLLGEARPLINAHGLVELRGPKTVIMRFCGIAEAHVGRLAETLLARALAHAGLEVLDRRHRWSREVEWKVQSGWGEDLPGRPSERDALSFPTAGARHSPREDLAATAEEFVDSPWIPGQPAVPLACTAPGKTRFLAERLAAAPSGGECAAPGASPLDPQNVTSVEVLYVQASTRAAGSVLGHTLLLVNSDNEASRAVAYELAAVTATTPRSSLEYLWRGLAGGFPSAVNQGPLHEVLLRYRTENRDLLRLRLDLNPSETARLLRRLDDVQQGWSRPYFFLTRNCSHLLKDLVETATGRSLGLPPLFGPDALVSKLERLGLAHRVPMASIDEASSSSRAEVARKLREPVADSLVGVDPTTATFVTEGRASDPVARAQAYATLSEWWGEPAPDPRAAELAAEWLWYSSELEEARFARADGPARRVGDPAMGGLWRAFESAGRHAVPGLLPMAGERAHSTMLGELEAEAPPSTMHTPLQAWSVGPTARLGGGAANEFGLRYAGAAYRFRLGEQRRYSVATGIDGSLFAHELEVRVTSGGAPSLSGTFEFGRLQVIGGLRPLSNPGYYVRVARLETAATSVDARLLDGGAVLEVAQSERHRNHALLTAGAAWIARGDVLDAETWEQELLLPVRFVGRLSTGTGARDRVDATIAWEPAVGSPPLPAQLRGDLGWGITLGSLAGSELALEAAVASRPWALGGPRHEFTLGVAVESN